MNDLAEKTFIVTGANSGVGRATTEQLATLGGTVVMVCRSRERGESALQEIRAATGNEDLRLRLADLSSLSQVRRLGNELDSELERVDALVNNAGVYRSRREITEDGFERTMAVNHLGHYLLTQLLFDRVRAVAGRVVTVSSEMHRSGRLDRAPLESILRGEVRYRGIKAYADSKLANVLFTLELARRTGGTGVTATAVHPGMLATRIWNQNRDLGSLLMRLYKPFMGSPEQGGRIVAGVASDPAFESANGVYVDKGERSEPAASARDRELAAELWELSARLVGVERDLAAR